MATNIKIFYKEITSDKKIEAYSIGYLDGNIENFNISINYDNLIGEFMKKLSEPVNLLEYDQLLFTLNLEIKVECDTCKNENIIMPKILIFICTKSLNKLSCNYLN